MQSNVFLFIYLFPQRAVSESSNHIFIVVVIWTCIINTTQKNPRNVMSKKSYLISMCHAFTPANLCPDCVKWKIVTLGNLDSKKENMLWTWFEMPFSRNTTQRQHELQSHRSASEQLSSIHAATNKVVWKTMQRTAVPEQSCLNKLSAPWYDSVMVLRVR